MGLIERALQESQDTWRDVIRLAYPLFGEMPIKVKSNPKSSSSFDAYTDNSTIYVSINNPKRLEDEFGKIVVPAYRHSSDSVYHVARKLTDPGLQEGLMFDNFFFLYSHELGHPTVCPNSKEDQKKIAKALYDGIRKADSSLSKAEVFFKVNNCKNLVWDVVVNLDFLSKVKGLNDDPLKQKIGYVFQRRKRAIENQPISQYPEGVIPDVYLISAAERAADIPISLMGALYATLSYVDAGTRQKALDVFWEGLKSNRMDTDDAIGKLEEIYDGFVSDLDDKAAEEAGIDIKEYAKRIKAIDAFGAREYADNAIWVLQTLTKIFDTPSLRYDSLKGFIKTIHKYISTGQKMGSIDPNSSGYGQGAGDGQHAEGGDGDEDKSQDEMDGNSMSSTLDDLADELGDKEMDDLLGQLSEGGSSSGSGSGAGSGVRDYQKTAKRLMSLVAADEFYKRNANEIEVRSPRSEAVSFDLGPRKKWKIKNSKTITDNDLALLDMTKVLTFQNNTGLPVLTDLGGGYYRLTEYELVETKIKSYSTQKTGVDIPDNWISIIDSSSSMMLGGGSLSRATYVGSGNKYDTLMRVLYGLEKGIYSVCKTMKRDMKYGVVNFSDSTIYSGMDSFVTAFDSRSHDTKTVKLAPQSGNTVLNTDVFKRIKKDLKPGKTVYTLITDGELGNDADDVVRVVDGLARQKDTSFLFVEIDSQSPLGEKLHLLSKKNNGVHSYRVRNVKDIKDKLQSVLIDYS